MTKSELTKALSTDASEEDVDNAYFGMKVLLNEMHKATRAYYLRKPNCTDILDDAVAGACKISETHSKPFGAKAECDCTLNNGEKEHVAMYEAQLIDHASSRCVDGENWLGEPYLSDQLFPHYQADAEFAVQNIDKLTREYMSKPNEKVEAFYNAFTIKQKQQTLNRLLQEIHGRGPVAPMFVKGGVRTLNEVEGISLEQYIDRLEKHEADVPDYVGDENAFLGVLEYSPDEIRALPERQRKLLSEIMDDEDLYRPRPNAPSFRNLH